METAELVLEGYRHVYHVIQPAVIRTRPVIALHGFGTSGDRTYRHVEDQVKKAGIPLYALDLLGSGASDKPAITYSLDLFAQLLSAFVRETRLERPVLLGHSMGGKIALATVVLFPDLFSGLTLVNMGGFNRIERFLPRLSRSRAATRLTSSHFFRNIVVPRTRFGPMFKTEDRWDYYEKMIASSAHLDLRTTGIYPRIPGISVPVLIVWGRRDRMVRRSAVQRVRELIPAAKLVILHEAGHAPMKDTPDQLVDTLYSFIKEIEGKNG